ncbi:NADP-dependent oxidoreductase [Mycobacterium sp. CSUR Q5927]|nr:NADP-dependent oxidoreductase [Mycobacterium sp. CSUR Q5927]
MSKQMRAIVIDCFGGPEVLRDARIERPIARPGNVVLKVAYCGVNPADWKAREGWLSAFFDYQFPFVLGFDAAGVIAEVADGVAGLAVGDRVVTSSNQGLGERGTYAEFVASDADRVVKLPQQIPFATAAAIPTAAVTAYEAVMEVGRAGPEKRVLVHGGAGGTGSFAIQIARIAGAQVATTCSPRNADYVRGLGAERVIDYHTEDVVEATRAWAPDGVDLVVDTVGQGTLVDAIEAVARGGIVAPIATLIGDEPQCDPGRAGELGVSVVPTMSNHLRQGRQLRALVELMADGRLVAPEITTMPLGQVADAHRRIQDGHVRGKIVLAVNEGLGQ